VTQISTFSLETGKKFCYQDFHNITLKCCFGYVCISFPCLQLWLAETWHL